MGQYKSREYCNSVGCEVQLELNKHQKNSPEYEHIKLTCVTTCKKTAWEFHDWIQKQGYEIIKQ
jgi:hypothetical protein